jgi:hypothetical protein
MLVFVRGGEDPEKVLKVIELYFLKIIPVLLIVYYHLITCRRPSPYQVHQTMDLVWT